MGCKPIIFPVVARPKAKVERVDKQNCAEPPLFVTAAVKQSSAAWQNNIATNELAQIDTQKKNP